MSGPSRLRLRQLATLVAVAEAGSLRRAAASLGVSQPALSKSLREVEGAFGRALFKREAKGLRETPHGAAVLEYARRMLREGDAVANALSAIDAGAGGRIRIGTIPTVSLGWLRALVEELVSGDSPLAVQVAEGPTDMLVGALRRREMDCVIGRIAPSILRDDLSVRALFEQKLRILARATHPLFRGRRGVALRQLAGCSWVLTPPTTPLRQQVERAFLSAGLPAPQTRLETYSLQLMLDVVASGDALTALPHDVAQESARQGRVRLLPFSWELPPICLMWLKRDDDNPALRRLLEAAR